jgi:predicted O-methyltransferase YrrM
MTTLEKTLLLFKKIVLQPSSLKQLIDYEDIYQKQLRSKYGLEVLPTLDIRALLPDFSETVNHYSFLEGTSLDIDIALLKSLARQFTSCRYLELGSWRGESLANVAEVAAHCTSISFADADLKNLGFGNDMIRLNRFFSKNLSNVTHIGHNTRTFDFKNWGQTFDLIFVDADHSYEAVRDDTKNVFSLLKDDHSMIVWHDYGYSTDRARSPVLAGILDGLPDDAARTHVYHVSNTLCAIYTRQPFEKSAFNHAQALDKVFSIQIKVENL